MKNHHREGLLTLRILRYSTVGDHMKGIRKAALLNPPERREGISILSYLMKPSFSHARVIHFLRQAFDMKPRSKFEG